MTGLMWRQFSERFPRSGSAGKCGLDTTLSGLRRAPYAIGIAVR